MCVLGCRIFQDPQFFEWWVGRTVDCWQWTQQPTTHRKTTVIWALLFFFQNCWYTFTVQSLINLWCIDSYHPYHFKLHWICSLKCSLIGRFCSQALSGIVTTSSRSLKAKIDSANKTFAKALTRPQTIGSTLIMLDYHEDWLTLIKIVCHWLTLSNIDWHWLFLIYVCVFFCDLSIYLCDFGHPQVWRCGRPPSNGASLLRKQSQSPWEKTLGDVQV